MSGVLNVPEDYEPTLGPSQYLEGYIGLWQSLVNPADEQDLAGHNELYGLAAITRSRDLSQIAVLASEILGGAVTTGAHELKRSGEKSLTRSGDFRQKLQGLLRVEYQSAVEVVLPEIDVIPGFPLESRRLMGALLRDPVASNTVKYVQQVLEAEVASKLVTAV